MIIRGQATLSLPLECYVCDIPEGFFSHSAVIIDDILQLLIEIHTSNK